MKAATKKALLESIEHWRENEQVKNLEDAKVGSDYCALCERFLGKHITQWTCARKDRSKIELCPVYERTGYSYCMNSPYDKADKAYNNNDLETFLKNAKKEREFLESLLPDEK